MANTQNLDLVKPLGTDHALVSVLNSNSDKIDAYAGAVNAGLDGLRDGLGILANGNTHAAITSGQFVYVKNHQTLPEGLYQATTNIAANGTLSTSNLTADPKGGLNTLSEQIGNLPTKTSNANGTAWKFNSGLMICEKTVTTSVDITNQAGSIYESGAVSLGSWAESFIEAPRISVSVKTTASCWIGNHASYDSANAGNIVLMRGSSRESTSVIFDVIGIGKWK